MAPQRKKIVVLGHGPVGHNFLETMVEKGGNKLFELIVFCEELRPAYDRVKMTTFFEHRDPDKLALCDKGWFAENDISLFVGEKAFEVDREKKMVNGRVPYDYLVFATGSFPFVPPTPGLSTQTPGIFVYRTVEDMQAMIEFANQGAKKAAVIGGGLLGLEAAKAVADLGCETHVLEMAPFLMPTQLDSQGGLMLTEVIRGMGIHVHLGTRIKQIVTGEDGKCKGVEMSEGGAADAEPFLMDLDMIVVSCGVRPRDELAKQMGLEVGPRGGVKVDGKLRSSDSSVFAVGEVASYNGMCYGLWAPGVQQAGVLVENLILSETEGVSLDDAAMKEYSGSDLSTKLKLLGTDVASLGASSAFWFKKQWDDKSMRKLVHHDEWAGVYKKLVFDGAGKKLMGALLVGDASSFGKLLGLAHRGDLKDNTPSDLLALGMGGGKAGAAGGDDAIDDDELVCSCNGVSAGCLRQAVADGLHDLEDIKKATKCGTGCGGCIATGPVKSIIKKKLKELGIEKKDAICGCIPFARKELFDIIKVKELMSYEAVIEACSENVPGKRGCEVCKPAVGSILASLWNDHVLAKDRAVIQDTNDRFLANIQRNGTYSVIPRIAGGEVTPEMLGVIADVGKKYGLYTKITGGQRIDLFGAQRKDLPAIWKILVDAGFESGHAYAKALRTVKSCVGSTWCRFGMQDSVTFAVRLENRYKGLRSPHKLKSGVSGCVRECAEAQGKDFGVVATEKGWNLYVAGNGGAKPAHAQLLASDVDDETCVKLIDRFLMFYIATAGPLERTAPWFQKLEGGMGYLKSVIVEDKLGICADLERMMEESLGKYECEWKRVVEDQDLWANFQHYANSTLPDDVEIEHQWVDMRGQLIPAPWEKQTGSFEPSVGKNAEGIDKTGFRWVDCGRAAEFPRNGGAAVKYGQSQLAVFCFSGRGPNGQDEWYATQNMCPHKRAFVLARGLLGEAPTDSAEGSAVPKVACPHHKRQFDLTTGKCLNDESMTINTWDVKVENGRILLHLPPEEALDAELATHKWQTKDKSGGKKKSPGGKGGDVAGGPNGDGTIYMASKRQLEPRKVLRMENGDCNGHGHAEMRNGVANGISNGLGKIVETFGADGGKCADADF
uniref:Rieske domain-containing protein n=1 Tax=Chromera velia CCMP2878 TaxID=1169474 RepID=A0A0G4FU50_9ALVE|eukprot:Cvel_3760.t1-p1 / transcript=Cvel_3760.t1 / gene=Cvel_3760 / organism=Chromera_velia_CCMP2878 / gene_product=Nitrite reductase [NAD(P)H] large subunit, putative / transcript_product=Nitrite reductase [NAD(P)H] large subunit, putative / location=Cvel_scaffold157:82205-91598(+) / protein_length=1116 / sequence_SO=supercontig / SO=protein_coding / is_pseudo=false